MMPIYLEQRFRLLLELAKNPSMPTVARENLAAAKEMVDTLFAVGYLDAIESKSYRSLCTAVGIMISRAEIIRAQNLGRVNSINFSDGVYATQVKP